MERQPEDGTARKERMAVLPKGDRSKAAWWYALPSHVFIEIWSYKGGAWMPVKSISLECRNKDLAYDEDWQPRLIVDFDIEGMGLCRKKVNAAAGLLRVSAQQVKVETCRDSVAVSCWGVAAKGAVDSSIQGFTSETRDTRDTDSKGNESRSPMSPTSPTSPKGDERHETREARRERRRTSAGTPMSSDKAQEYEQIPRVAAKPNPTLLGTRHSEREKRAEERHHKDEAVQQNHNKTKNPCTTSPLVPQNENKIEHEEDDNFIFGSVFELGKKIGSGSFSSVFVAKNLKTGEDVAVKLEQVETDIPQLLDEAKMLSRLGGGHFLARVHWYGTEMNYNVLVMDLLGSSVADLLSKCGGKFRAHTALTVTTQMFGGVEYVHQKGYIHRDLKPENFAIGLEEDNPHIRIIDFGLARRYRCPKTHRHNPSLEGAGFAGTARYASARAHRFEDQSRRDDVESLGYIAVYLFLGSLPWQGVGKDLPKREKHAQLAKIKKHTHVEDLCKGMPQAFVDWFRQCQCLDFAQEPDYRRLRKVLQACSTVGDEQRLLDWEM